MAPNSQKEEQSLTPSPTQSKTQESQVAPQEESKPKKTKAKATTPGVTQDSDSHYTIR